MKNGKFNEIKDSYLSSIQFKIIPGKESDQFCPTSNICRTNKLLILLQFLYFFSLLEKSFQFLADLNIQNIVNATITIYGVC